MYGCGIFTGVAPPFILLAMVTAFLLAFFTFADNFMKDVHKNDMGIYKKQKRRIELVNLLLIIAWSLITFHILYCNFDLYTYDVIENYIIWIDTLILVLMSIAIISARNFFKKALAYRRLYTLPLKKTKRQSRRR